jgi:predicted DNA-binding transcriptional regulator YafY
MEAIPLEKTLQKYIGRIVEIIYTGKNHEITQRRIEVRSVSGGTVKAYCLERGAPRVFRLENILAVNPAAHQGRWIS